MRGFAKILAASCAVATLSACGGEVPLHMVGQPMLLPDGHSSEALISGGVCADPQCFSQDTVTAGVHTFYRGQRLVSQVHDMRPVTAPSGGFAVAGLIVPAAIEGGARRPVRHGPLGGLNGAPRLGRAAHRHAAEHGTGRRVVHRPRAPLVGVDPFAVDEVLLAQQAGVGEGQRGSHGCLDM